MLFALPSRTLVSKESKFYRTWSSRSILVLEGKNVKMLLFKIPRQAGSLSTCQSICSIFARTSVSGRVNFTSTHIQISPLATGGMKP